ncbi:hypothetical protein CDAR_529041 [Caerostris darwini]|uniref:Uncharacterized protein n=1 Tax=Caerostris darwini TaxID=1538125 RepID=A0AAV4UD63_9ARAC|nr:hypothetical protein CDAR_529041 [Caerostris darwini]
MWLQRPSQQAQGILSINKYPSDKVAEIIDKLSSVYNSSEGFSIAKTDTATNSSSIQSKKIEALEANNSMNLLFTILYSLNQRRQGN